MTETKPSPTPRTRPSPTPRTSAAEGAGARRDERPVEPVRSRRLGRGPSRRATLLACLAAATVLLAAGATWFAFEASNLRAGNPEDNAALVDADATTAVTEEVSTALESIFSYNYANLDRTRRAADRVLLDDAMRQYTEKFATASKGAKEHEVVRTTSVRAIGVRSLHADTARVLVFLDQQTLAEGGSERRADTAYLDVVAKKVGGSWKIAKLSGAS